MARHVGGVEEMSFEYVLKVSIVPESRMEAGILFQVAGEETTKESKEYRWKLQETLF